MRPLLVISLSRSLLLYVAATSMLSMSLPEAAIAESSRSRCAGASGAPTARKPTARLPFKWLNENEGSMRRPGILTSRSVSTRGKKVYFEYSPSKNRLGEKGQTVSFTGKDGDERTQKPTVIFLHGVEDRMQNLHPTIAKFEEMGWGALAVDQIGHGKTAELNKVNLKRYNPITPDHQAKVVVEIAKSLGLTEVIVFGHSMGGINAVVTATALKAAGIEVVYGIPSNGFISSLDRFFQEHGSDPVLLKYIAETQLKNLEKQMGKLPFPDAENIQKAQKNFFEALGINVNFVEGTVKEYVNLWMNVFRMLSEPQFRLHESATAQIARQFIEFVSDPIAIKGMKDMYTKYEKLKNEIRAEGDKLSDEQIAIYVHGAIEATLGLRQYSLVNRTGPSLVDPDIPFLYIAGTDDPVVVPPQVDYLKTVAGERGWANMKFAELPGDHFIPQKMPTELTDLIVNTLLADGFIDTIDIAPVKP